MPRRNAFQDWAQLQRELAQIPENTTPVPPTPIDLMGMAKPKQRSREYEKRNRSFTYRLTDKELGAKIAAVAASLQVTVDEVARVFVEVGIREAKAGRIPFNSIPPVQRRMTLYPTGSETWKVQEQDSWQKSISPRERQKPLSSAEKARRRQDLNKSVVAYRWPAETDQSLAALTETVAGKAITRSDGRKGWVLTILLRYGLSLFETGKLPLQPQPKIVKMSLGW
jgi:hypothetical protein